MASKPELVVALDVPSIAQIEPLLDTLPPEIQWFKVGLELFTGEGPGVLKLLQKRNKKIFLDLKLHDISNTVARAVASAAKHGVAMMTLHAAGGRDMMKAAAEAAAKCGPQAPKLVAVTILTSFNDANMRELGISRSLTDHTLALGKLAISCGMDGLVCSVHEAGTFRQLLGDKPILVTPGIRPADSSAGDQKRIATPEAAVTAGSNFIVVGRPILEASDQKSSALSILNAIETAYKNAVKSS